MATYPIEIVGIYITPEHRVFGRSEPGVGGMVALEEAELVAHTGIRGDRFFKHDPAFNGHVTFFAVETWEQLRAAHTGSALARTLYPGPEASRRNILTRGVDWQAFYGQAFSLGGIPFAGTIHCAPCKAMDVAYGPGALKCLHGRGGLRARLLDDGILRPGPTVLVTETAMDPARAGEPEPRPRLP